MVEPVNIDHINDDNNDTNVCNENMLNNNLNGKQNITNLTIENIILHFGSYFNNVICLCIFFNIIAHQM